MPRIESPREESARKEKERIAGLTDEEREMEEEEDYQGRGWQSLLPYQKSFIKLYSALFIVVGYVSTYSVVRCFIPPNAPLIPAIIFRFVNYFQMFLFDLYMLPTIAGTSWRADMFFHGFLYAGSYCTIYTFVNFLSFVIATFIWAAIFTLLWRVVGPSIQKVRNKLSGPIDVKKESLGRSRTMYKCDLCGAEFSQSKGADGCPECNSPDISEV